MKNRQVLQPITQESTPSLIAAQLRRHISNGTLAPGAQLVEMDIARELGVSRGPVREAIQRLTQEGILVSIRNKGVFVAEFGEDDLRDVYEARTAIEKAAAGMLLSGDYFHGGEELLGCVARMEEARVSGDPAAMTKADRAFHERLVEMAGSPRLSRMHTTLLTETRMCLNRFDGRYEDESVRVVEHRGLAEALREGKRDLVAERLDAHKVDALARLLPVDQRSVEAAS